MLTVGERAGCGVHPVITALRTLTREGHLNYRASLGSIVSSKQPGLNSPCLKKTKQTKREDERDRRKMLGPWKEHRTEEAQGLGRHSPSVSPMALGRAGW